MPTHYLESSYRGQEVAVHSADLYLLEEWDSSFDMSYKAQRSKILSKWLEIGFCGRMAYSERINEMSSSHQDITDAEKDILIRIRDISALRGTGSMRIVRTFYGDNSDEAFDEMIESCEFDGQYEVFNNPELYDEGSKDGLESLHDILTLLPQIIDGSPYFHVNYAEKMVEAKEEAEKTGLPKFPSEEFDELIDRLQCAAQWDHVLIYDKHAHDNHGSLLMVYLDNLGRVLRYFRLEGYEELTEVMGLWIGIFTSHDEGSFMWINAESGEDWKADQLDKRWGEVEALETLLE